MTPTSSTASAPRMTTSGPNAWPSLSCAAKTLNTPIADAGDQRETEPGRAAAPRRGRARRGRPPAIGQRDPDQDERRRDALEDDPGGDRDERRDDAGDRRDDPHPPDRQPAIEGRDPDPTGDRRRARSSRDRPRRQRSRPRRSRGRGRAPSRRPARRGRRRTARVRRDRSPPPKSPPPQATAETRPRTTVAVWAAADLVQGRRPGRAGSTPAAAAAAGAGAAEPCRHRRLAAGSMSAATGAPLSTLVGPSSTTTASAASS